MPEEFAYPKWQVCERFRDDDDKNNSLAGFSLVKWFGKVKSWVEEIKGI